MVSYVTLDAFIKEVGETENVLITIRREVSPNNKHYHVPDLVPSYKQSYPNRLPDAASAGRLLTRLSKLLLGASYSIVKHDGRPLASRTMLMGKLRTSYRIPIGQPG